MTEPTTAAHWLTLARDDLAAACVLAEAGPFTAKVCFLAQQCAERALRAVLAAKSAPPPRKHDLAELLDLVRQSGVQVPPSLADLSMLTVYAAELRYATLDTIPASEGPRAIKLAAAALAWAEQQSPS